MTKIKICGITTVEETTCMNKTMPDYIGFVFAKSKRNISKEQAKVLRNKLRPEIQVVGVFVNESIETICSYCKEGIIDLVQLHGEEDENYTKQLNKQVSVPIIRAVRVKSKEQVLDAEQQFGNYLLLDTYVSGEYGGSGRQIEAGRIPQLTKPFFLAGGLSTENVRRNIELYQPYCVDVSSGVETNGKKDPVKVLQFIESVRRQEEKQ